MKMITEDIMNNIIIDNINIIDCTNVKYLSEKISSLPKNCIFNKGKVGCGGTSVAINDKENHVIIVSPFVSLIENKTKTKDNNLLGVMAGTSIKEISDYIINKLNSNNHLIKIMVTIDSLYKVIEAISLNNNITTNDIDLVVDEYHLLFIQYSFRRNKIKYLLDNYKRFKSYCFMTATPLKEEFILEELKTSNSNNKINIVECKWEEEKIIIDSRLTNNCISSIIKLINEEWRFDNGNLHIFISSLDMIEKIINNIKDNISLSIRCVFSKYSQHKTNLQLSDINSPPAQVNFYTSTVFEGSDIFDKEGKTVIVSDNKNKRYRSSLVDISCRFTQIIGRIRDSKYRGEVIHIFSIKSKDKTKDKDLIGKTNIDLDEEFRREEKMCKEYNMLSSLAKKSIIESLSFSNKKNQTKLGRFIVINNNEEEFICDKNLLLVEKYLLSLVDSYSSKTNVINEYSNRLLFSNLTIISSSKKNKKIDYVLEEDENLLVSKIKEGGGMISLKEYNKLYGNSPAKDVIKRKWKKRIWNKEEKKMEVVIIITDK